jgi:hypothetical protein
MPEKFEEAVIELRKRFTDKSRPDYVFQPAYHKRIPADGVGFYMDGIWQQVVSNKDLDLPTQQELLAQFRCDEIAAAVTEAFMLNAKGVRKPVEAGSIVEGLGKLITEWLLAATAGFDTAASRYHQGVYQRKRAELLTNLFATLSPIYLGQLNNAEKATSAKFVADINSELKAPSYDFAEVVERCTRNAQSQFLAVAKGTSINPTRALALTLCRDHSRRQRVGVRKHIQPSQRRAQADRRPLPCGRDQEDGQRH